MTNEEVKSFAKNQRPFTEWEDLEKRWEKIHKEIEKKCENCLEYHICKNSNIKTDKICDKWFLDFNIFQKLLEETVSSRLIRARSTPMKRGEPSFCL